jgi:hypothetical protein
VKLTIPGFEAIPGFEEVVAVVLGPGMLSVQVIGEQAFTHAAGTLMMHGPIDALLQNAAIRMRRFLVLNQGDARRIVMTVHYEELDHLS